MPSAWERPASYLLSTDEKSFILKAVDEEQRVDGRRLYDWRKLDIKISLEGNSVTVLLGKTLVEASVAATIEQPASERPSEGMLRLNVENSTMAAPGIDASNRAGEDTAELQRVLEKAIRDIRAVDLEALCIAAGRKVWRIQLDVRVLDAAGNTTDTAFLAALAALMAFKRPDVSVKVSEDGARSSAVILPVTEREAVPLSLHQAPLAVSFALFQDGNVVVVDPSMKEEAAADGLLTVVLNAHNEICLLHKAGGLGLTLVQIMRLVKIAAVKKEELNEKLKAALEAHELARVAARVRRKGKNESEARKAPRSVAYLMSTDISSARVEAELGVDMGVLQTTMEASTSSEEETEEAGTTASGAAAGQFVPATQEEEEEDTEMAEGSDDSDVPTGIGVLLPGKRPLPDRAQDSSAGMHGDGVTPGESGMTKDPKRQEHQPPAKVSSREPLDEYERIASLIAGPVSSPRDLGAAVKKKRTSKDAMKS